MNGTDHYFISRAEQQQLTELLDTIPALVEDLAVTVSRQDRLGNGPRISRGKQAQPLPYNVNASEAADQLHNELASWVRHTCEHRTMSYDSSNDTLSLARWLKRWIIALALSPGSEEALPAIRAAIHHARRATDRPNHKTPGDINEAANQTLNARGIENLARELDDRFRTLTRRRVHSLHEAELIQPIVKIEGMHLFNVGDVLIAHLSHPIRKARKTA